MDFKDFWYVVALSEQLTDQRPLARTVLDEWLVIFRDAKGNPVALRDRCLHRNSRLSQGSLQNGSIQCPYHGWKYDAEGRVIEVPAEGPDHCQKYSRQARRYASREQDGYVYVQLGNNTEVSPFLMIHYQEPGWETVRVINRFKSTVTNCAENFIDIPHTASVHPGVFRNAKQQQLQMSVERLDGVVTATYHQETDNLGWFGWFLNPDKREIQHTDQFFAPNITRVEYNMGPRRQCFITSQSVPVAEDSTLVYTDVTFNYGLWNKLARPFVRWTAQKIISQDVAALKVQQETIEKYGERFAHTPVDTIHVFVESIREAIAQGKDPRTLPEKSADITFWV